MLGAGGYQDQIGGVVEYLAQAVALELRLSLCLSRSDPQFAEFGLASAPLRKVADASERARKAVTNRIRDSIAKLDKDNPTLARHLANSIKLGTFCSYTPERPVEWAL